MVIEAAEKGGAVVVWWADLNQKEASNFPTPPFMQESTKISLSSTKTSSKIRLMILSLNKNYRPLQKFSQSPLLELSRVFTFYLKSTILTTQVDHRFCLQLSHWTYYQLIYRSDARSYEHYWTSRLNKAWKKFRPVRDLNPWPLRYRCYAQLTNWANKATGSWSLCWIQINLPSGE